MSDHSYLPEGYHGVTPSLAVKNASEALAFYANAFGAQEIARMMMPDVEKVMHAEFRIANSIMMLSDEFPEMGVVAPEIGQGGSFMLYVEDTDSAFQRAIEAGATQIAPVEDMFWGDRIGRVADPYGYRWMIAHRVRECSIEEVQAAGQQWAKDTQVKP